MFSLPQLPSAQLFDERGIPTTTMLVYWQQLTSYLSQTIDELAAVSGTDLPSFQAAITAAQHAADLANGAAIAANAAAMASAREQALVNSYITPDSVLSATTTTILIAAHVRHYADGTTANVNAGSIAVTAAGDTDYVCYSDAARAGGTVTYQVGTIQPPQTGNTHVVGAVTVPATGTATGGRGPRKPGFVDPDDPP